MFDSVSSVKLSDHQGMGTATLPPHLTFSEIHNPF